MTPDETIRLLLTFCSWHVRIYPHVLERQSLFRFSFFSFLPSAVARIMSVLPEKKSQFQ